jgi:hypothetical protein
MAPLPETNTDRLFFGYNDGSYNHELQFRYDTGSTSEADVATVVHNYLTALDGSLYVITFVAWERALAGSNVRNPVTWPHASTYGTSAMPAVNAPRYLEFTGRASSGRRWHLTQFGVNISTPAAYKIAPSVVGSLDDARTVLQDAFNILTITSIDHLAVAVNASFPVGFNDHFISRARG